MCGRESWLSLALILATLPLSAEDRPSGENETDDEQPISALLAADEERPAHDVDVDDNDSAAAYEKPARKFWIGLDCRPPQAALRSQLGLSAETGLLVNAVVKDSPATAAGIQLYDVITAAKAGDVEQQVSSIAQFADVIQQTGEKPLTLTVIRVGKPLTVYVTPAVRPPSSVAAHQEMNDDEMRGRRRYRGGAARYDRSGYRGHHCGMRARRARNRDQGDDHGCPHCTAMRRGHARNHMAFAQRGRRFHSAESNQHPGRGRRGFAGRPSPDGHRWRAAMHGGYRFSTEAMHSPGLGHGGCPMCAAMAGIFRSHALGHHHAAMHGGGHHQHVPVRADDDRQNRPRKDVGQRLEQFVKRLEQRLSGGLNFSENVSQPATAAQLRSQLRRLQAQQEELSKSLRDLSEALEKSEQR